MHVSLHSLVQCTDHRFCFSVCLVYCAAVCTYFNMHRIIYHTTLSELNPFPPLLQPPTAHYISFACNPLRFEVFFKSWQQCKDLNYCCWCCFVIVFVVGLGHLNTMCTESLIDWHQAVPLACPVVLPTSN